MNTNVARRFARCIALPAVAAGIIGGAALGLAGTANAAEGSWSNDPQVRTGIVAEPKTKAKHLPRRIPAPGGTGITLGFSDSVPAPTVRPSPT